MNTSLKGAHRSWCFRSTTFEERVPSPPPRRIRDCVFLILIQVSRRPSFSRAHLPVARTPAIHDALRSPAVCARAPPQAMFL